MLYLLQMDVRLHQRGKNMCFKHAGESTTTICVDEEGKNIEKAVQIKPEATKRTFREMLTCVADEECEDKPKGFDLFSGICCFALIVTPGGRLMPQRRTASAANHRFGLTGSSKP